MSAYRRTMALPADSAMPGGIRTCVVVRVSWTPSPLKGREYLLVARVSSLVPRLRCREAGKVLSHTAVILSPSRGG